MLHRYLGCVLGLLLVVSVGCGEGEQDYLDDGSVEVDEEYGKPVLGETVDEGKGDSMTGAKLLPVSVDDSDTQVWKVSNQWGDIDTPAALAAGMAWEANSGLTWEQKYQAWIRGLEPTQSQGGYYNYTTYYLQTPHGKMLPAPSLECAETAIFLRATFASWYNLPFILSAWDGGAVHFGHFGIRKSSGKYGSSPRFKTAYSDYSSRTAAEYQANWPKDSKLRGRKLSKNGDDENEFLCEGCFAGAYFDEIFLNKRVGYFMVWLLTYTGSMHLASSDNAFHIDPTYLMEGDVLLERWQKKGIGHTLLVKKVDHLEGGKLGGELASGSMPRRQPKWEDAASSKSTFTNTYCGGPGENSDGDAYAKLGGGIKRFRQPQIIGGYWYNMIAKEFEEAWIADSEVDRIAGRIAKFEELLGSLSPEEQLTVSVQKIEEKRLHLRNYPASCAARIEREKAFNGLYALQMQHFSKSKEEVDREYRIFEDYVFAELEYSVSKTCCWNQSTAAMYEIIMDLNNKQQEGAEGCVEPVVFMNSNGGYETFKNHAESLGRGDEWAPWSEDESCPQRDVENDTETDHVWTAFCSIVEYLFGEGPDVPDACADQFEGNHSLENAASITPGDYTDLKVCEGSNDWYVLVTEGESLVVRAAFEVNGGDIDLFLYNEAAEQIDQGETMASPETVKLPAVAGTYYVEVKLYGGTSNSYALTVEE